jgi:FkbM family methyltransferase
MVSAAGLAHRLLLRLGPRLIEFMSSADRQFLADAVLEVALRARGYNNFLDHEESGEAHLVSTLSAIDALGTCIDIGANEGKYAALLLKHGAGTVYALEPHPAHQESLQKLRQSFPERLSVIEAAASSQSRTELLRFNTGALAHASLSEEINAIGYVNNDESVPVRTTTIDDLVTEFGLDEVDFIKIDTEGFEDEVLAGASELFRERPPKAVQVEFNRHQLIRDHSMLSLSRRLRPYSCFQLLRNQRGVRSAKPALPASNIYHFSNFVFVRDDIVPVFLAASRDLAF